MHLCTLKLDGHERAAVRVDQGALPVETLNRLAGTQLPFTMLDIIRADAASEIQAALGKWNGEGAISLDQCVFAPPYRHPGKLWGIGLNYLEHAADLEAVHPKDEPASFMKPATTIIGAGDEIVLPTTSQYVTAEGELGVIIGKTCKDVSIDDVPDYVFGYTTILDMTAVDILQKNPRFLTRAKSFDTFFSFGPWVVTADEIDDVMKVQVSTWVNGEEKAVNTVDHMQFPPPYLTAFHSQSMTLEPGDIISTGTPGAATIHGGDQVSAKVAGVGVLSNPVNGD